MAQAQLIQGNAETLLAYLYQHRQQQNLLLIVPEQSEREDNTVFAAQPETALERAHVRNGIPLFPISDTRRPVTMELVKQLMDEE